jgi:hypothetical protein
MRRLGTATALAVTLLVLIASPAISTDDPSFLQSGNGRAVVRLGTLATLNMKALATNPYDMPDIPGNDPTVAGGSIKFYELGNPVNHTTLPLPTAGWSKRGTDPLNPTALKYPGAPAFPGTRAAW